MVRNNGRQAFRIFIVSVDPWQRLIDDVGEDWLQVACPVIQPGRFPLIRDTGHTKAEPVSPSDIWTENVGDSGEYFKL